MKASQLRAASQLIEALDLVNKDLIEIDKGAEANVVVRAGSKQLKFKPPRGQYKDFLLARRDSISSLLSKMGVTIDA